MWVMAAIFALVLIWPLIYIIGIPVALLTEGIPSPGILSQFLGGLYFFILIYVFGIVFWGIPYTLFVIGFFLWSKNKSIQETYSALQRSPLILALITALGFMVLGLVGRFASGKILSLEDWKNLGLISLLGVALCLIYGYIFVGLGMAGYKLSDFLKLRSESETSHDISDLDILPTVDNSKNEAN